MCCLSAFATDIFLPAMPDVARWFGTSLAPVQWSLGAFLFSYAIGQIIFGILSDRYGRKIPLLAGVLLFAIGNYMCVVADSVEMLIIGRFISGFGGGTGSVSAFAIARDHWSGTALSRNIARIAGCVSVAPVIAPIYGAMLNQTAGWQSIFWTLTILAILLLGWIASRLPSTRPLALQTTSSNQSIQAIFITILRTRSTRIYLVANAASFSALFAFISLSPGLFIDQLGTSPELYAVLFATNAVVMVLSSFILARLVEHFSLASLLGPGSAFMLVGGVVMLLVAASQSFELSIAAIIVPMMLTTFGIAITMSVSMSGIMQASPGYAAKASSVAGCSRFICAALTSFFLSQFETTTVVPLVAAILVFSCFGIFSYMRLRGSGVSNSATGKLPDTIIQAASSSR